MIQNPWGKQQTPTKYHAWQLAVLGKESKSLMHVIQSVFPYSCQHCLSCPAKAIQMNQPTWAICTTFFEVWPVRILLAQQVQTTEQ